jgi:hypothetical protein|tara:strand:+ start:326 stop:502 length:177 start_codon:yes stop_codon:yes gene_type:complete
MRKRTKKEHNGNYALLSTNGLMIFDGIITAKILLVFDRNKARKSLKIRAFSIDFHNIP